MKHVLVVSYYFPPMGLGGVQRAAKLVKYLPVFGWYPVVLTVKGVYYHREDPSLLDDLGPVPILRTESFDPLRLVRRFGVSPESTAQPGSRSVSFLGRLNRSAAPWFNLPDTKVAWIPFALPAARRIIHRLGIRIVLTTSPPHSSHLIGLLVKRLEGIAWIADFRDSWLAESFDTVPTRFHRAVNRGLLRRVLRSADCITAISEALLSSMRNSVDGTKDRFVLVPNGFDKDDFSVPVSARGNRFRLVYSGTSNAVHTPEPFFRGAGIALRRRPELLEQMEVFFVGAVSDLDFEGMVHRNGLQGIVRTLGYVRHADSVGYLMSADLLVLTVPALSSEGVVTGKLYEYLASGKPILSVVPEGEAKRIVQRLKRGPVAAPDRPDAIADALIRCYDEWKRGRLRIGLPRFAGLEPYDRKLQAGVMARLFDGMTGT